MNPTKRMAGRRGIVTIVFYAGCIALFAAMLGLTNYINSRPYVLVPVDPVALGKALDAYAALNNLLITLATGLLAGLGLFLTSRPKQRYAAREFWPAAISALFVCLSLYWGYIASQNVEWATEISAGTGLDQIQWPRELQAFTMLLAVVFFADFVRRDLTKVD